MRSVNWIIAMVVVIVLAGGEAGWAQLGGPEEATPPANDAAILYARACQLLRSTHVFSPSETDMAYAGYPPYPPEWWTTEKAAREANGPALRMAHEARAINVAHWPNDPLELLPALNLCRGLANEMADAAMYQDQQGDHAGAIETIRDELHLADLLLVDDREQQNLTPILVSAGIEAMAIEGLEIVVSDVPITHNAANTKDLQFSDAEWLRAGLLAPLYHIKKLSDLSPAGTSRDRFIEQLNRANAERALAGLSLVCHLFRLDKGRWPNSLDEILSSGNLANIPIDPWGDGKQTLGYVLIKNGLPDGGDRPLVYSRCRSRDGLFYRVDEPMYGYYSGDGTHLPFDQQKQGGQFRDVARWRRLRMRRGADDKANPGYVTLKGNVREGESFRKAMTGPA